MRRSRLCSTCRWWAPDSTCRFNAPLPTSTGYRGKVPSRRAVWPRVEATDWCAQWRKRKPAKRIGADP